MKKTLLLISFSWLFVSHALASVVYVKANASGSNSGTSWSNAYTNLNSALSTATDTIWVANGLYPTTSGTGFRLWLNLKVFGGFAGSETQLSQRNWSNFQTILDGHDSSRQVVRIQSLLQPNGAPTPNTSPLDIRLDGFKIMNGVDTIFTSGPGAYPNGFLLAGGMFVNNSVYRTDKVVITNCLFTQNHGGAGGAMTLSGYGDVSVTNCRFENNTALYGGALQLTGDYGAGIYSSIDSALRTISDCTFSNNTAQYGGAIHSSAGRIQVGFPRPFITTDSTPTIITRCIFRGNSATIAGGVIADSIHSRLRIYNSVLVGNKATRNAVYYRSKSPAGATPFPTTLVHCTIAGNRSTSTDTLDYPVYLYGADTVRNCIFWDNVSASGQQIRPTPGTASSGINTNIIPSGPGSAVGFNTYSFNPQFVAPGSSASAPFPFSGVFDYHLKLQSGAIDTGLTGIPAQGNLNTTDLDGSARVFGSKPDLGAYEYIYCQAPLVTVKPSPANICQPDSLLLTASGGNRYLWNAGIASSNTLWANSGGTYHVINVIDSTGCRSRTTFNVTVYPKPNPIITKTNNTISVVATYATYQWYKAGVAISGATSASYNPSSNGLYKIVVTTSPGGCKDSTTYNLTNLGVGSSVISQLSIYPNPSANGRFHISIDSKAANIAMRVTAVTGQKLLQQQYPNGGNGFSKEIDLSRAAKGVYFVEVIEDGMSTVHRLLIE